MEKLTGNESMKEIRKLISSHDFLKYITTTGKGRKKDIIINEINEKITYQNAKNAGWIKLRALQPANKTCLIGKFPLMFNKTEESLIAVIPRFRGSGMYEYSNKKPYGWSQCINYPQDFDLTSCRATLDEGNQCLYICNSRGKLIEYDIKTKSFKTLSEAAMFGAFPQIINIDGNIHIVGGHNNKKHVVFDKITSKFKQMHYFNDSGFLVHAYTNVLYLKSRKTLLLFVADQLGTIYQFCLIENKWTKWNMKMPDYLRNQISTVVSTKNERFIVFIRWGMMSIYDYKTNCFRECAVKCPKVTNYQAVLVYNERKDELLTFGFVNACFRSAEFLNIQPLPIYLVQLIGHWVSNEFIHLVDDLGDHWKINVDKLLI